MKRILSVLFLCLALGSVASAQLSIRIEGSALFDKSKTPTQADINSIANQLGLSSSTGLRAGGALELGFLGFVYIAPGVNYHRHSEALGYAGKTANFVRQELVIPVNLGLRIPLGFMAISAEAGPQAHYELSSSMDIAGREVLGDLLNEVKSFNNKKLTYGLNASAAVEFSGMYVRGGVIYPLSDKLDLSTLGEGASALINEIKASGLDSKRLTYFLGAGFRF